MHTRNSPQNYIKGLEIPYYCMTREGKVPTAWRAPLLLELLENDICKLLSLYFIQLLDMITCYGHPFSSETCFRFLV